MAVTSYNLILHMFSESTVNYYIQMLNKITHYFTKVSKSRIISFSLSCLYSFYS